MQFDIKKRFSLLDLLAIKTDIETQNTLEEIRNKIKPDEKTVKSLGLLVLPNGQVACAFPNNDEIFLIDFDKKEIEALKKAVSICDANKNVSAENLELCKEINSL